MIDLACPQCGTPIYEEEFCSEDCEFIFKEKDKLMSIHHVEIKLKMQFSVEADEEKVEEKAGEEMARLLRSKGFAPEKITYGKTIWESTDFDLVDTGEEIEILESVKE